MKQTSWRQFAVELLALVGLLVVASNALASNAAWSVIMATHQQAKSLSYSGVMITQSGEFTQSSRLLHFASPSGDEDELLEKLDGQPSSWIRHNDVVQCILPRQKLILSERRLNSAAFPQVFSSPDGTLVPEKVYKVQEMPLQRVAGRSARVFKLTPKDDFRHEYRLYVDKSTNLLLRSELYSSDGHLLEQVGFTEISFDPDPAKKPSLYSKMPGWTLADTQVMIARAEDLPYTLPDMIKGFKKTGVFTRVKGNGQTVDQTVYSDGLSTLSVFVQKAKAGQSMPSVPMAHGAVVSRSQTVKDHLVTALGEVPLATLNQVLKSVQWKSQ